MPVKINVINCGQDDFGDHKYTVENFVPRFQEYFKDKPVTGEIFLFTGVLFYGYDHNEIDILMLAKFDNFALPMDVPNYNQFGTYIGETTQDVEIKDICCTIEMKRTGADDVEIDPLKGITVYYRSTATTVNVSAESRGQLNTLINVMKRQRWPSPTVVNLIWLAGVSSAQAINNIIYPNVIYSQFSVEDFFKTATNVNNLYKPKLDNTGTKWILSANRRAFNNVKKAIETFTKKPQIIGRLTRGTVERITKDILGIKLSDLKYEKGILVYRGKAGTGKTTALLRIANLLREEHNARCLILTYNQALAGDIKRSFAFFQPVERPDGRTLAVRTSEAFFGQLMESFDIKRPIPSDAQYNKKYADGVEELNKKINIQNADGDDVANLKRKHSVLNWDYVLIDEAQDWSDDEMMVIKKIYADGHLIVADGVDQIVRGSQPQNWIYDMNPDQFDMKNLSICMRQGPNLVSFINDFAKRQNMEWHVEMRNGVSTGKIELYRTDVFIGDFAHNIQALKNELVATGNELYDLLLFVPGSQVEYSNNHVVLRKNLSDQLSQNNIKYYDGLDYASRENEFPIDQMRVFRYDSCRGLEGWTVVCLDFDVFIKERQDRYVDRPNPNVLNTLDQRRNENVNNWSLMPLSRPINKLIVTFADPTSTVALQMKDMLKAHSDYMECFF